MITKMKHKNYLLLTAALAVQSTFMTVSAQGTVDDYRRAYSLRERYSWKTKNTNVRVHAIEQSHRFW